MIIRRLQAENTFKYSRLDLTDLPERGRILISGSNESGKTAIVETLCLALFGRTVALEADRLAKAVRWGETRASVVMAFTGRDGRVYTVQRFFDTEGSRQAALTRGLEQKPLVKGEKAVNRAVMAVTGYDFQSFVDALYLNQGRGGGDTQADTIKTLAGVTPVETLIAEMEEEIVSTRRTIAAAEAKAEELLDRLALLDVEESVLPELQGRRDAAAEAIIDCDANRDRWRHFARDLSATGKNVERAVSRQSESGLETNRDGWQVRGEQLEQALEGVKEVCQRNEVEMESDPSDAPRAWLRDFQQRLTALTTIIDAATAQRRRLQRWLGAETGTADPEAATAAGGDTLPAARAAIDREIDLLDQRRLKNRWWIGLSLFFFCFSVIPWALVQFNPDGGLAVALDNTLSFWHPAMVHGLLFLVLLFFGLLVYGIVGAVKLGRELAGHEGRLSALLERAAGDQRQVEIITAALAQPLPKLVAGLSRLESAEWAESLRNWSEGVGRPLLEESALSAWLQELQSELAAFLEEMAEIDSDINSQLAEIAENRRRHETTVADLDREMEHERIRRQEDQTLRAQIADLEKERNGERHALAVRETALDLLRGTHRIISSRFKQELRRFISRSAPLFTAGRYQHLRIDDELRVSAFSTVKNDFVDVEEISTGLRQQLILAVRMALAQALAARSAAGVPGSADFHQFIILDEPFAFYDAQRVRASLDALLEISERITQVWVIAQDYEPDIVTESDRLLVCDPDGDVLSTATA